MKMKHWAYMGMALIEVNASLLGGVRAAEIAYTPTFYRAPSLDYFTYRLGLSPRKAPKSVVAPVTVRLFAGEKLKGISIKSPFLFTIAGQTVEGPISISAREGKLWVKAERQGEVAASDLSISSLDERPFEVRSRQGNRRWTRGEMKIKMAKGGRMIVVNRLEMEDYVSGILQGELGTLNLSPEVLKAQIVVARTYVLSMRGERHHHEGYEFCDLPHCQVFKSIPHEGDPALEQAITSVRGEYLSHHGLPIAAFYHHSCGGMTSRVEDVWPAAPRPYLVAVQEDPNGICRVSNHSVWYFAPSRRTLAASLRRAKWLKPEEALDTIRVVRTDPSGRAQVIMIQGNRTLLVPVGKLRNAINQYYGNEVLRSAMFTVTRGNDRFVFRGRGWGHGVGMCQEGAMELARHDKTYPEILAHYFPKTKISHLK